MYLYYIIYIYVGISHYTYIYMVHLWDFTITNENIVGIESFFKQHVDIPETASSNGFLAGKSPNYLATGG